MAFTWDRNYHNHEQVAGFLPAFLEVYAEMEAAGKFPYNDSFRGRVEGIEGPNEDTAIYMLQNLKRLRELDRMIADALADGFQALEKIEEQTKFSRVVEYGFYMGGTGWREWENARILPNGCHSLVLLPKGKRTHGHILSRKVLVKP